MGVDMKTAINGLLCSLLVVLSACSLKPNRPVTKLDLYDAKVYNYYVIRESPESVLAGLNADGEVVLEAKYKDTLIYLKILATSKGLKIEAVPR
jgi:hypothetical protein